MQPTTTGVHFFLVLSLLALGTAQAQQLVGDAVEGSAAHDRFGYALDFSSDGRRFIAGARQDGFIEPYVSVFELREHSWTQVGEKLRGTGIGTQDEFASIVAISDDGRRIATQGLHVPSRSGKPGRITVFEDVEGEWLQVGDTITGSGKFDGLEDGMDFSADGTRPCSLLRRNPRRGRTRLRAGQ